MHMHAYKKRTLTLFQTLLTHSQRGMATVGVAALGPIERLKASLAAASSSVKPSPGHFASTDMLVLQEKVQQHLRRVHEIKAQLRHNKGSSSLQQRLHHHYCHRHHHVGEQHHSASTIAGPENTHADSLRELRRRFKALARHQHLYKRECRILDADELGVVGQNLQAVYSTPLPKPTNDDGDQYPAAQRIGRCNYDDFGRLKSQVPVAARRFFDWEHFLEVRHGTRTKGEKGEWKSGAKDYFGTHSHVVISCICMVGYTYLVCFGRQEDKFIPPLTIAVFLNLKMNLTTSTHISSPSLPENFKHSSPETVTEESIPLTSSNISTARSVWRKPASPYIFTTMKAKVNTLSPPLPSLPLLLCAPSYTFLLPHSGSLTEAELGYYMHDLLHSLPALQNVSESFSSFYVYTAVRRFIFFLDPTVNHKISIAHLVASPVMEELMDLATMGPPPPPPPPLPPLSPDASEEERANEEAMAASAAQVAAEAFAWQERATKNWFSTENTLRVYNMVRATFVVMMGGRGEG